MALAISSSSPTPISVVNGSTTTTTGAFSPPASTVIFIFFILGGSGSTQSVSSVTDSLTTPLAWSLYTGSRDNILAPQLHGTTEVWWAPCPSAQTGMTITANYATGNTDAATTPAGMIQIIVFSGAATVQNGNASIRNDSTIAVPSQTVVTTVNNSWVFGIIQNWSNSTGPTVGSNQTTTVNGTNTLTIDATDGDAFWVQLQNASTATAGTTVTLNDTAPSISHHFSMVEVVPLVVSVPAITTQDVTSVTATTATGNGTVVSDNNSTITERGVCWNTSANPTTANSKATAAGTIGSYTASITGLSANTLYHVRAYAINGSGTAYGRDVTFINYLTSLSWMQA